MRIFWVFLLVFVAATFAEAQVLPSTPTLTFLNNLPADSSAEAINNNGQIVGTYFYQLNQDRGFLYDLNTQIFSSFTFPGPNTSGDLAWGINDSGTIVGEFYRNQHFASHGFRRSASGQYHIVDDSAQIGNQASRGINNLNTIVGYYQVPGASFKFNGYMVLGGVFSDIIYPGANFTMATAINDAGTVVGNYGTDLFSPFHSFMYQNGAYTEITFPQASQVRVVGINNLGDTVGFYFDAVTNQIRGFLFLDGVVETVDCPNPTYSVFVAGINDARTFVGFCEPAGSAVDTVSFYGIP